MNVFISHASEDKERFVLEFGEKLRNKGINAWIDKWEIKLGDNLVNKIFEEGIGRANFIIIILSKNSAKQWVKEELSVATIRRIEENIKIIPVIIDESIEVPVALSHLKWICIKDLSNYTMELGEIVNTIFGIDEKPPLGETPKFLNDSTLPGYYKIDSITLRTLGDIVIDTEDEYIDYNELKSRLNDLDVREEDLNNSLEILESEGIIQIDYVSGGLKNSPIRLMFSGFCDYFKTLDDSERIYKSISSAIYNENKTWNIDIAHKAKTKTIIVNYILNYFEKKDYINLENVHMGGIIMLDEVTAKGKRYFNQLLK